MPIDMASLPGTRLLHKFIYYIKQAGDISKGFHIIMPEVTFTEEQRGETCKLKALSEAIKQVAEQKNLARPSLYKAKIFTHSLRQIAKKLGSVVGEIYSLDRMKAVCLEAGFESEYYEPFNADDYVRQLEALVDKNSAPIVFYDLCVDAGRIGYPYIGDGQNEHAAVVVGYYKDRDGDTRFLLSLWNKYYDFDGMELALSACHSLKNYRVPETFIKTYRRDTQNTGWNVLTRAPLCSFELCDAPIRVAKPMNAEDTPLRGKIMVVTKPKAVSLGMQNGIFSMNCANSSITAEMEKIRKEQAQQLLLGC